MAFDVINAQFDAKTFNPQAFGGYYETIPQPNKNELIKSRVLVANPKIQALLSSQTGSYYGTIPFYGRIDGEALNYDGQTDITATSTDTFTQSVIAIGRAKAWMEKDFSKDITGGVDFMSHVASQVAEYWNDIDTGVLMSIINGIFAMTGKGNEDFVTKHTHDITGQNDGVMTATTLNVAMQKACGDKRGKFSLVFMHSAVATNLENMKLLEYLKYTDKDGVERALPLATWNGRTVIIDDGLPTEEQEDGSVKYTTYVFGAGAIEYAELGAKVPFEMSRDAAKNGGEDTLYSRRRFAYMPKGISFTQKSVATLSPTNEELENGANWELIHNGSGTNKKFVDHKEIAIARIFSLG